MRKQEKTVTIKSIAEDLGVSFSTVSKSLNNNPTVKDETKQLVLKRAQEMGYCPNMLARGLRTKSTKTIGIVFNDIENPVLTYIFKTISIEMANHGYATFICDSQFNNKSEELSVGSVLSRLPDFAIIAPASTNSNNIKALVYNLSNVIVFDRADLDLNCNFIDVDYTYGGYISACELLSKGHRDILIITEPLDYPYSVYYVEGIKKAFAEYNLEFKEEYLKFAHSSLENACSIILSEHDQNKFKIPFSAAMCFSDNFALGVYKAASILGLSIPDDFSVIGFDDESIGEFCVPALTTIHLPKEQMANTCIKVLKSTLKDKVSRKSVFSLTPHIVRRNSVKSNY